MPLIKDIKLGTKMQQEFKSEGKTAFEGGLIRSKAFRILGDITSKLSHPRGSRYVLKYNYKDERSAWKYKISMFKIFTTFYFFEGFEERKQ